MSYHIKNKIKLTKISHATNITNLFIDSIDVTVVDVTVVDVTVCQASV